MHLTEGDFSDPELTVSVLSEGIHGGFINPSNINEEITSFCEGATWVEEAVKFLCSNCGNYHTAKKGDIHCVRTFEEASTTEQREGFRITPGIDLRVSSQNGHNILILEHSSVFDPADTEGKSIVFVKNKSSMEFSDPSGTTVYMPLHDLPVLFDEENDLISRIEERRMNILDWGHLDNGGSDFQEIIYRIIDRSDDFTNTHWGGSGPDQGKDAFCSIRQAGKETNILVQAKFNNNGSSITDSDLETACRKAGRQDCQGVIFAAVKTSGDLETDFYDGSFMGGNITFSRLWSGPELKEMIAEHPDLISEYFLN